MKDLIHKELRELEEMSKDQWVEFLNYAEANDDIWDSDYTKEETFLDKALAQAREDERQNVVKEIVDYLSETIQRDQKQLFDFSDPVETVELGFELRGWVRAKDYIKREFQ